MLDETTPLPGARKLIEYVRRQMEGPFGGYNELLPLKVRPENRYMLGVLYPQQNTSNLSSNFTGEEISQEEDVLGNSSGNQISDDPIRLSNQKLPSACGLTFYTEDVPNLSIKMRASKYRNTDQGWKHILLTNPKNSEIQHKINKDDSNQSSKTLKVLDGEAEINILRRPYHHGWLVTVTIINSRSVTKNTRIDTSDCLFQVRLDLSVINGSIKDYPDPRQGITEESREIQVISQNLHTYAIGHGTSADWVEMGPGIATSVNTEMLPSHESPNISFNRGLDLDILEINWLSNPDTSGSQIKFAANELLEDYESWSSKLKEAPESDDHLKQAHTNILSRIEKAQARMSLAANLIETDEHCKRAFQLANLAMLIQMRHTEADLAGSEKSAETPSTFPADYLANTEKTRTWRPFQIAFLLLTMESLVNGESENHELVDLIWFPTGGGKTEAYLLVAAFEIFYRRLKYGSRGGGTVVITRYTLNLLTAQQFSRAAGMISACEFLRRQNKDLGDEAITIGLWVGYSSTPNLYENAQREYEEVISNPEKENPFQVHSCPWCGTNIIPQDRSKSEKFYGINAKNNSFRLFCPSFSLEGEPCPFRSEIPVKIVDEQIYANPPTFLIGTIDKFARLCWVQSSGNIFGRQNTLPPSLIIQDELHLITGPLGSTTGIYESAILSLIELKGNGRKPKIIASTATTTGGAQQVSKLYGRNLSVFPPSGTTNNDSYFACDDPGGPRVIYAGILARSGRSASTGLIHVASAVYQGPEDIKELSEKEKESFSTLVIYHNSLRELGQTSKFVLDDIPQRIGVIAGAEDLARPMPENKILELRSNSLSESLPKNLERLSYRSTDNNGVNVLLCTNMFSVGVDVQRLGLIIINGQPKTISEYIQATGRIGRDPDTTGLAISYFSDSKPRDRSHYEHFKKFHINMGLSVEPQSVTPFSLPSRQRSLHAAFVILMRHWGGIGEEDSAANFNGKSDDAKLAKETLLSHIKNMDPGEYKECKEHLSNFIDEWDRMASEHRDRNQKVWYSGSGREGQILLKQFGDSRPKGWETPNSMRNVDQSTNLLIRP